MEEKLSLFVNIQTHQIIMSEEEESPFETETERQGLVNVIILQLFTPNLYVNTKGDI